MSLCQVWTKNSQNWNNGSCLKFASKLLLSITIVSSSVTFFSNLVGNQITMIYYYFTMIYKNVTASKMLFASFFCHNCVTRSFSYKIIVNILKPPNSLSGCYFLTTYYFQSTIIVTLNVLFSQNSQKWSLGSNFSIYPRF